MLVMSSSMALLSLVGGTDGPQPVERTLALGRRRVCGVGKTLQEIDCLARTGVATLALPEAVEGNIVDVSAGGELVCARTDRATMACWEFQSWQTNSDAELRFEMDDVADFAVGDIHRCVVRRSGAVECWGNNDQGQVGDGTRRYRPKPVSVEIAPVAAVEVTGPSTCALLKDGSVWCWGGNPIWGNSKRLIPEPVAGLEHVLRLLPDHHAVLRDGSLVHWDVDPSDGSFTLPQTLAASGVDAAGTCFVTSSGDVSCRGFELATKGESIGLTGVAELLARGADHCARDRAGRVSCWTRSRISSLPLPGAGVTDTAARIAGIKGAVQVGVGSKQACARTKAGRISCWRDAVSEVPLKGPASDLFVRGDWACALTDDGLWCWGPGEEPHRESANGGGRLLPGGLGGICVALASSVECRTPRFTDVVHASTPSQAVAMLGAEPCYIEGGQLRCGKKASSSTTIDVDVSGGLQVISDRDRVCSLRPGGTLDCTELVVSSCDTSSVGVSRCERHDLAAELRDVTDLDFSFGYGCVVHEDGRTRCWPPFRSAGEDGLFDVGASNIRSVSVEGRTGCGVDASGDVWCWGHLGGPLGARHRSDSITTAPTRVPWLDRDP